MKPIFMIGTQRSGSNLLRLMLNQLPEIAAPHPPHILQRMMPLVPLYGDLGRDKIFRILIDDVCRLVEFNPVPWSGVVLDREDVFRRCNERSLLAVYAAVYDICAEAKGAQTWCCKSLANIKYLYDIESFFGTPRYIYLYRDGRDVAVSFRKAVVGEKHYYHIAKEWAETQELALKYRREIDPSRFLCVSYEELTDQPEATAKRICSFLGVEFRPSMLDYHQTQDARETAKSSSLWQNVLKPVMHHNTKKFLKEMKTEDIKIFETVAGHVLDALGYERVLIRPGREMKFSDEEISRFDKENKRLKDEMRSQVDPEDLRRRERQEAVLREIQSRGRINRVA